MSRGPRRQTSPPRNRFGLSKVLWAAEKKVRESLRGETASILARTALAFFAILAVVDLAPVLVAAHAGLEVANTFAKTFRQIGYAARAEQHEDNHEDNQQLRHSK